MQNQHSIIIKEVAAVVLGNAVACPIRDAARGVPKRPRWWSDSRVSCKGSFVLAQDEEVVFS
jgi:hypothetical protein